MSLSHLSQSRVFIGHQYTVQEVLVFERINCLHVFTFEVEQSHQSLEGLGVSENVW